MWPQVVLALLTAGKELPLQYRDHALTGKWRGFRDCHIEPDWVLLYKIDGEILHLTRTGSHAELFGK